MGPVKKTGVWITPRRLPCSKARGQDYKSWPWAETGPWGRGRVCVGWASEAVLNSTGCIWLGHGQCLLHTCFNQWRQISSRLYISRCVLCALSYFNHVWLSATLWTVTHQIPLSIRFFRQQCWSGLPCPSPEDLPDSAIEPSQVSYISCIGRWVF